MKKIASSEDRNFSKRKTDHPFVWLSECLSRRRAERLSPERNEPRGRSAGRCLLPFSAVRRSAGGVTALIRRLRSGRLPSCRARPTAARRAATAGESAAANTMTVAAAMSQKIIAITIPVALDVFLE